MDKRYWHTVGRALQCTLSAPWRELEVMPAAAGGWRWTVAAGVGQVQHYGLADDEQDAKAAALAAAEVAR